MSFSNFVSGKFINSIRHMLALTLLLTCCPEGHTQQDFASFTLENDFLNFPDRTDRFYTNGFRYERVGPRYDSSHYLINKILIRFSYQRNTSQLMHGAFFGQNIYTPSIISVSTSQENDRPYAGWLYWGAKSISTNRHINQRITSEFSIGLLGPEAIAGETQTFIHKMTGSTIPEGWDHQIDSDIGINYLLKYEIGTGKGQSDKLPFQAILAGESSVGTIFTYASGGALVRVGKMNNYFIGYNVGANSIQSFTKATTKPKGWKYITKGFTQAFVFAKINTRYNFYNAMLQGGLLNLASEYVIASDDITRLTGQLDYGVSITFRSFTIMYSRSVRSQEFSFGPERHYWAAFNVIFAY